MHNRVFVITVAKYTTIIGFADNLAIATEQPGTMKPSARGTMEENREAVFISNRKKMKTISIRIDGYMITSKSTIKYQEEISKEHLNNFFEKRQKLARIMFDIGGPRYSHKLLTQYRFGRKYSRLRLFGEG